MKIKLEDEKDIFEAITEAQTEEEINKWKYIQDMFSGWKEQDSTTEQGRQSMEKRTG